MLKILYAASNSENSKIQLLRFLKAIEGKPYQIKVAAYKKSSPKNININWTLDCLLNIFRPKLLSLDNENFKIYYEQVKYFSPDLIISDTEYFTSQIANMLNLPLWQCSSSLINFALSFDEKYNIGLFKKFSYVFNKDPMHTQRTVNILDNSAHNFVYSHFGDIHNSPQLKSNFEWIRPYSSLGRDHATCFHNVTAASFANNKKILSLLKQVPDSVMFSQFSEETHPNVLMKDISEQEEYFCNLRNSYLFVCEGQTSFLADAFYNKKYVAIIPNFTEPECILNAIFSNHFNLSTTICSSKDDIIELMSKKIECSFNPQIKLLDEKIAEYYC
jgi:uncharacterized protein (TIGR00661 family)